MNTTSGQPAYLRIADQLRADIVSGRWPAGHRLPPELQMVEDFGVARMTLRQALDILQLEGLIERKRGRSGGTFVRGVRPIVELTRMEGLMPQLRERGLAVSSEVLAAETIAAPDAVARNLRLDVGAPVFDIKRLRTVRSTPLLIENSYFPAELFPGMLDEDLSQSLYELLGEKWDLRPVRKTEQVSPGIGTGWEQLQLEVGRSISMLRIVRVSEAAGHRPVEYSEDCLRADVAQITIVTGAPE